MSELDDLRKRVDTLETELAELNNRIKALETTEDEQSLAAVGLESGVDYWIKPEYVEWYAREVPYGSFAVYMDKPIQVFYADKDGLVRFEQYINGRACVSAALPVEFIAAQPPAGDVR